MAAAAYTEVGGVRDDVRAKVQAIQWAVATADGTGGSPAWSGGTKLRDKSVQISGTWGGATCEFEGSNDGVTYFTLKDPAGNSLQFSANGLKQILEFCRFYRPRLSTAGSGAALTVTLMAGGGGAY